MTAPIGANSKGTILPGIEGSQKTIQSPFSTLDKLATTFRDFGQKVSLQSVSLAQTFSPPKTPLSGAIPGIGLNTKGQQR